MRTRTVCFILISSALLWSVAAAGYSRYGLYQEMLAAVTVVAVAFALTERISWGQLSWRTALAFVLFGVLAVQAYFACSHGFIRNGVRRTNLNRRP